MRFIREYTEQLTAVTGATLEELHRWTAAQPLEDRKEAVQRLNDDLMLGDKPYELRHDLPCLTVGSRDGLVLVSANPGWHPKASAEFARSCEGKPDNYWRRTVDYFAETPDDGSRNPWWYRAFRYLELLPSTGYRYPQHRGPAAWEYAHSSREFGGWELIPIPSSKDGITSRLEEHPALEALANASVKAVLTLAPKLLLVGQKQGCRIVKNHVPEPWTTRTLGKSSVTLEYHRRADSKEIVLIPRQFISCQFNGFKHLDVVAAVRHLRGSWPSDH